MQAALARYPIPSDWKVLYRAAIHESDKSLAAHRIADAEKAILARARELFYGHGTLEEKEALEDALYTLRALKNSWTLSQAA